MASPRGAIGWEAFLEAGEFFESYPWWIVVLSNLLSVAIYGLGAFIIYQVGWIYMAVYLVYALVLEIRLLRGHCVHCFYYGKVCAFGKGRLSSAFFKQGDPERWSEINLTWWAMIPDMLVALLPVLVGIVVLVIDFSWPVLAAVVAVAVLATAGNGAVRGSLACNHCIQRQSGCPAEKLFGGAST
jgi:hypothetical protein